ncbi:hypothetical protein ACP70R_017794 [Stipagrostis hirtigluma subsp. patula]
MNTNRLLAVVALVLAAASTVILHGRELEHFANTARPIHLVLAVLLPAVMAALYLVRHPPPVYLIDYACFKGVPSCRLPASTFVEHAHLLPFFDNRSVRFMTRMLERSGLGDETSLPPTLHYIPPYDSLDEARAEAELVIFSAIDDLFAKTDITPGIVDILVVNCSVFAPVPSLTDMIVNRYKLRCDIRSVNLSGMGCSAAPISIGLAAGLLQATPHNTHALVVSTETITPNFY